MIWVKNIFIPMYGQYNAIGRFISFFVRLFQIISRSLILFFWFLVCSFLFILWFGFPMFVIYGLILQFGR